MKQIRFDAFGPGALVARCQDVPDPGAPSAWEVVVDVLVSAINPADISRLNGQYGDLPRLPATLGMDAVGRVVACGASVTNVAVGDRVILVGNDNWCQRRRIAAAMVFKVPHELDLLQLAGLKVGAGTALELVRRQVELKRGDWLVQTAPLSSVGRAVIQIARHDGLRTLNVVRRPEAVAEVLALGGDVALVDGPNLVAEAQAATAKAPVRLALDGVAGDGVERIGDLMAKGSVIVSYGVLSGQPIRISAKSTIFQGVSLKGFWLLNLMARLPQARRDSLFTEAVELLAKGVLHAEVAATYPIDAITAALRHAEAPGRRGKVFLLPNGPIESASLARPAAAAAATA